MATPLVNSIGEARSSQSAGRRFRLRFEYRGVNYDNDSGRSSKFWEIEGNGTSLVTVRWGKIGTAGQSQGKTFADAHAKAYEKEGKGYRLVRPIVAPTPKPTPAPVAAPKPAAPTKLAGIFASIHRLTKKAADCYGAFNRNGDLLFDVTEAGFRELIQANPMIVITS